MHPRFHAKNAKKQAALHLAAALFVVATARGAEDGIHVTLPKTNAGRDHWAFRPLRRPPVPAAPGPAHSAIDRFLLAELAPLGLTFAPPADGRVWLRRATLGLTGLPPTPAELEAFPSQPTGSDTSRAMDRLLSRAAYGERWARPWLDVARFAESSGFEHDYDRPNAWHYRDYVVSAFNRDQPYDEFVRWQLAGDELAPEDPRAWMATGFLASGVFPTQITANEVEKARYDALDDMAVTTGAAFLGLSVGCARCHDHKFDPISSRDYYHILATFTTTVRSFTNLVLDPEGDAVRLKSWETAHAAKQLERDAFLRGTMDARFQQWLANPPHLEPPPWLTLDFEHAESAGGARLTLQSDGSLLASGTNVDFDHYTLVARIPAGTVRSLRIEALSDPSMVRGGPGRADNGNFALSDLRVTTRPAGSTSAPAPVRLTQPRATFEQPGLPAAAIVDSDKKSGWAVDPQFGKDHAVVFAVEPPLETAGETELTFELRFDTNNRHSIGRLRLAVSGDAPPETAERDGLLTKGGSLKEFQRARAALERPATERTGADLEVLRAWHRAGDSEWLRMDGAFRASLAAKPEPVRTQVLVATEGLEPIRMHTQGADFLPATHFLKRGDVNQKEEVMTSGFLPVLSRSPEDNWRTTPSPGARTPLQRQALARWLTDVDQGAGALLARVMVNRIWALHFGRGLVATPNDFGAQGEAPSHPDLLEWLADDFVRSGWSVKHLQRLILSSSAYQQSARNELPPELASRDAGNRLLHQFPRRRLEAEAIRDSLLAVSGLLDPTSGGPGTLDENHQRRALYFQVKRSQLSRTLQLFDAPDAVLSAGNRPATITAPQALLFLNSPLVRAGATAFARRLEPIAVHDPAAAVRLGYLLTTGRPPDVTELAEATGYLSARAAAGDAASRSRALTDFCQVLFGLNEFVYVE